jgi:3-methyladenine DNA glycosylase AlkD
MMQYAAFMLEIQQALTEARKTDTVSKITDLKKYIGTSYDFISLSVPAQRRVYKKGYSFSDMTPTEQLSVWDYVWQHASCYEQLAQCLYFAMDKRDKIAPEKLWKVVHGWVKKIDNWAHSDSLSDLYAHLLERLPGVVYRQYQRWNHSANPWERRQSLVGMLLYSKKRVHLLPVEQMLPLVTHLLHDEDYFVQKGLGWTLREINNVYPDAAFAFLRQHITDISPVAFTAAIEKLSPEQKALLKQERSLGRKR